MREGRRFVMGARLLLAHSLVERTDPDAELVGRLLPALVIFQRRLRPKLCEFDDGLILFARHRRPGLRTKYVAYDFVFVLRVIACGHGSSKPFSRVRGSASWRLHRSATAALRWRA